jgi:N-acetylmuramoyl-L-alanine amidase
MKQYNILLKMITPFLMVAMIFLGTGVYAQEVENGKPLSTKEQIAQLVNEIQLDEEFVENMKATNQDLLCLAVNNYYEARGEGLQGKIAVSEVVVNRSSHPAYPNTPCEVVKQSSVRSGTKVCQFSWVCTRGVQAPKVKEGTANHVEWYQSIMAAIIVYHNNFSGVAKGATHFYSHRQVTPAWSNNGTMIHISKVGNHTFLKLRR